MFFISIGYSALITKLNINGNTTLKKQTYSVYFDNVQVKSGSVSGEKVTTAPSTTGKTTTKLDWEVSMDTPGEFYEFSVDIINDGTVDAMIEKATAGMTTSALTETQKKYLDYTIKYENDSEAN